MSRKRAEADASLHDRNDPSHPLLRELVFLHVDANDGASFDTLLTRVPGIGEEIIREEKSYKVTRVQHERVAADGRARFGWHAFIETELQPEDPEPPKRSRRSTRRRKSGLGQRRSAS
jgi:hypothetical protein